MEYAALSPAAAVGVSAAACNGHWSWPAEPVEMPRLRRRGISTGSVVENPNSSSFFVSENLRFTALTTANGWQNAPEDFVEV